MDYAGQSLPIIDPVTGEIAKAQIFLATFRAGNYTFAEDTFAEDLPSWDNFRLPKPPQILVPDNLKAGITNPYRYEPYISPTYQDLAQHYETTIIPARVGKCKVKSAVLVA